MKVGPELTYFYSQAVFTMEKIESKNFKQKSDITAVLLKEMMKEKKNIGLIIIELIRIEKN